MLDPWADQQVINVQTEEGRDQQRMGVGRLIPALLRVRLGRSSGYGKGGQLILPPFFDGVKSGAATAVAMETDGFIRAGVVRTYCKGRTY